MDGAVDHRISRRELLRAAGSGGVKLAATSFSLWLLAACGSGGRPDKTLRIGVLAPLSGQDLPYGAIVSNSLDAAVRQLNATRGGVPDTKLELLLRDSKSDRAAAVDAYRELIRQSDAVAVLWCASPGLSEVLPEIGRSGIPVVTAFTDPFSAGELVPESDDAPSLFQVSPPHAYTMAALADYARNDRGYVSAAMLYDPTLDPDGTNTGLFREKFTAAGITVTALESFAAVDPQYPVHLNAIQALAPQVLYVDARSEDLAAIVKALASRNAPYVDTPTAKGTAWHPQLFVSPRAMIDPSWLGIAGDAVKAGTLCAWYVGGFAALPSYSIGRWTTQFLGKQASGGEELPANALATVLDGIKNADSPDPAKLAAAIEGMGSIRFASLPIDFSRGRHLAPTSDHIVLMTVERLSGPAPTDPPYELGKEWDAGGAYADKGIAFTLLVRPTLAANRKAYPGPMNSVLRTGLGTQCTKLPDGSLSSECKIH